MKEREHVEKIYSQRAKKDINSQDLARTLEVLSNTVFGEANRFVFELLQNADDSPLPGGSQVDITLTLTDSFLVFSHNGKHFTSADVTGISSVASRSSGKDLDEEKTGYKGIGFKSVFGSSDEVYISSNNYLFKYDRNYKEWQDDEYPWQIIPIWVDQLPEELVDVVDEARVSTLIRLKDRTEIAKEINHVFDDCQIILFLRNVHKVTIYDGNRRLLNIEKRVVQNGIVELFNNGSLVSRWLIRDAVVQIPNELHEKLVLLQDVNCPDKLKSAAQTKLTFAARVENDKFVPTKGAYLYCYLPTKVERGFAYLINADFLTNAERTDLTRNIWNEFLFEQVAENQLLWFQELHSTAYKNHVLTLFRSKFTYSNLSTVDNAFNTALENAIKSISFLPNIQNNQLVRADEILVDPFGASEMFPPGNITSFFKTGRVILPKEMSAHSAISDYTKSLGFDFICKLVSGENTPNIQPDFSTNAIYLFYNNTLSGKNQTWLSKLKELQFIPDDSYQLRAPKELYFPVEIDEALLKDFGKIHFMHQVVLENCKEYPDVMKWLQSLGIREPSDAEVVRKTVFPLIQSEHISARNAIAITRFIFKVFKGGQLTDSDYANLKNLKLTTQNGLQSASACYLPDEFEPTQRLSKILSGAAFVSTEYKEGQSDAGLWGQFFKKLGVRDTLTIAVIPDQIERNKLISSFPYAQPYFGWLDSTEAYPELYFSYRNSGQHSLKNFTDIPFREFLKRATFSKMFWNQIILNWEAFKQQCAQTSYHYFGGRSSLVPSYVEYFVREEPSIPCTDQECRAATEVFSPSIKPVVNGVFPVADLVGLNKEQEEFFGFKTKLSLRECFEILEWAAKQPVTSDIQRQLMAVYEELIALSPTSLQIAEQLKGWRSKGKLLAENNSFQPVDKVFCFSVRGMQPPVDSEQFLKLPKRMGVEEARVLCGILSVSFITYDDLVFVAEDESQDVKLKQVLLTKSKFLAIVASQANADSVDAVMTRLLRRLEEIEFTSASKLNLIYTRDGKDIYTAEVDALIVSNRFVYKGSWESPLQRYAICNQLCVLLNLAGLERELELLLQLKPTDIRTWLESKGYVIDDKLNAEHFEVLDDNNGTTENTDLEPTEILIEATDFIPSVQPLDIDYTEVQPILRASATFKVDSKNYARIATGKATRDIGRWAEEYVFNYLKENLKTFSDVKWMNEIEESYKPYDFIVTENGSRRFIEVKGTPSKEKSVFYMSQDEWQVLTTHGNAYSLFRLFEVGTKRCRLERLDNPLDAVIGGALINFPVELRF